MKEKTLKALLEALKALQGIDLSEIEKKLGAEDEMEGEMELEGLEEEEMPEFPEDLEEEEEGMEY